MGEEVDDMGGVLTAWVKVTVTVACDEVLRVDDMSIPGEEVVRKVISVLEKMTVTSLIIVEVTTDAVAEGTSELPFPV